MFSHIKEDEIYLARVCFSDKATFHMCICGTVKRHNCCLQ